MIVSAIFYIYGWPYRRIPGVDSMLSASSLARWLNNVVLPAFVSPRQMTLNSGVGSGGEQQSLHNSCNTDTNMQSESTLLN